MNCIFGVYLLTNRPLSQTKNMLFFSQLKYVPTVEEIILSSLRRLPSHVDLADVTLAPGEESLVWAASQSIAMH